MRLGGIAYAGSGAETLAVGLNKAQTKYNVLAHGIRTPDFVVVSDVAEMRRDQIRSIRSSQSSRRAEAAWAWMSRSTTLRI